MKLSELVLEEPLWRNGWYQFSARRVSPNFGPRPTHSAVDLIVLHCISLPPGQFGGNEVEFLFLNQLDCNQHPYFKSIQGIQVSAHFYIRRQGELMQFVSADERAWHAGVSSYQGRSNCNDNSIGIELEGCADGLFEDSQYETLADLCSAIVHRYPISNIVGHEHVAPGRKTDPGSGFDWQRLQKALSLPTEYFPATVVKNSADSV